MGFGYRHTPRRSSGPSFALRPSISKSVKSSKKRIHQPSFIVIQPSFPRLRFILDYRYLPRLRQRKGASATPAGSSVNGQCRSLRAPRSPRSQISPVSVRRTPRSYRGRSCLTLPATAGRGGAKPLPTSGHPTGLPAGRASGPPDGCLYRSYRTSGLRTPYGTRAGCATYRCQEPQVHSGERRPKLRL